MGSRPGRLGAFQYGRTEQTLVKARAPGCRSSSCCTWLAVKAGGSPSKSSTWWGLLPT